jgi:hypothetical protein
LFGAVNLAMLATLGFNIERSKDDVAIIWAAGIYATGVLLLFVLLICFAHRKGNSLILLRALVLVVVGCQFVAFLPRLHTPFREASPLLKFQQVLDWVEVATCIALFVVLRSQTTNRWLSGKTSSLL